MEFQIIQRANGADPSTSMSLLERATLGNQEAWDHIVFLYSPLVERWCRRWSLAPEVIRDIGQEVFLKLFKNLRQFRRDKPDHSFRKWLWRVTQRALLDHAKKSRREPHCLGGSAGQNIIDDYPEELPHSTSSGGAESMHPDDLVILVRRCLELVRSEFQPSTFEAFWQAVVDGSAPSDVARALDLKSVGAVYTAKSRVLKRLRELLELLGEEIPNPVMEPERWRL